mgnify:CR=1 FL=1
MIRLIEQKDQEPLARLIRSVFEEYGAPLVNTVYDDPRTWHIWLAVPLSELLTLAVIVGYSLRRQASVPISD